MQPHNTSLFLQTPRAFAWRLYNLQKLLDFDQGPLRWWTSADKTIALLDFFDDLEDRRVREQLAQAGSSNVDDSGETEMCTPWPTQVWINSGQALNHCQVNSGQAFNYRQINSGQTMNCYWMNSGQALNCRRINSGQAMDSCQASNCCQVNSGQDLNSRRINSGQAMDSCQASNCCQVNSRQALNSNRIDSGQFLNCRREENGQALKFSQTNSYQIY
jgi:hypothetical protein